jgi:hypothetical protein
MLLLRTLRLAVAGAALTAAAATAAGAQSPVKLGLAGGVALPVGDSDDGFNPGYNGTVTIALNAPLFPVGLRVDGMFNRMKGEEGTALGDFSDVDVSSVNANVTFNLIPLPVARVYAIGGAGYYRTELRDLDLDPETNFGYNAGVGIRLGTGGTQLFVEGRYHRINLGNDETFDFVPVTIGFLF